MARAQEHTQPAATAIGRQQVTLQGSGIFTRKVTDSGIIYEPASTGGILAGYRFNINHWLGVEGDYDGYRDTQKFLAASASTRIETNANAATGAGVINIPNPVIKSMKSFAFIGGGALLFDPRDTNLIAMQTRSAIVFGGGVDIPVTRRIAIRAQAKNFMYKAPDFGVSSLKTGKWAQTQVPSAGFVFSF